MDGLPKFCYFSSPTRTPYVTVKLTICKETATSRICTI
jgi:hypothetical protein